MKKNTLFKLFACTAVVFGMNIGLDAQIKIGSNPTTIGGDANLEVEATDTNKTWVRKADGRTYVENKPQALVTDSIVLRYTDGELRQMSLERLLGQIDTDGDGIPNWTDTDDDGDSIPDVTDTCALQYGCTPSGCPRDCVPKGCTSPSTLICLGVSPDTITVGTTHTYSAIGGAGGTIAWNITPTTGVSVTSGTDTSTGGVTFNSVGSYTLTFTSTNNSTPSGCTPSASVTCVKNIVVERPPVVRVGYYSDYAIGETSFVNYNNQLIDKNNYGSSGTYNKVDSFIFTQISLTGSSSNTVSQLLASYDIICTGYTSSITTGEAVKLRQFVDSGRVLFCPLDNAVGTTIHQEFGGTGSIGAGTASSTTNTNTILNGVFGDSRSATINGAGSFGGITTSQLPSGATVLATTTTVTNPRVWLTGTGDRAIFLWDEGVFRNTIVTGSVNTVQEYFLHNLMAYALDQLF